MERVTLNIGLPAGGVPPVAFRVFAAGPNQTTNGVFIFDAIAADMVMAAAADWGNEFPLDYGHGMFNSIFSPDPAEAGKAAGWFTPEIRSGELWASSVSWTPKATEYLRNREYRYISPTFDSDKDGRINELLNVALTNIPATKHLTPLVASRQGDTHMADKTEGTPSQIDEQALTAKIEKGLLEKFKGLFVSASKTPGPTPEQEPETAAAAAAAKSDLVMLAKMSALEKQVVEQAAKNIELAAKSKDLEEKLAKTEDERLTREFTDKAAKYKSLAIDPAKHGATFKALAAAAPAEWAELETVLASADAALAKSQLFREVGVGGGADVAGAYAKLEQLAVAVRKTDPKLTKEQSMVQAIATDEGRELYRQYTAERRGAH